MFSEDTPLYHCPLYTIGYQLDPGASLELVGKCESWEQPVCKDMAFAKIKFYFALILMRRSWQNLITKRDDMLFFRLLQLRRLYSVEN